MCTKLFTFSETVSPVFATCWGTDLGSGRDGGELFYHLSFQWQFLPLVVSSNQGQFLPLVVSSHQWQFLNPVV